MTRLAIAVNLSRCVGCHTCANACKMQNNVPDGMLWNRVLTEGCDVIDGAQGEYPNLSRTYIPLACQHCDNAACQRVCPTGATYKDDKGRDRLRQMHRLPYVHGRLPIQRTRVQLDQTKAFYRRELGRCSCSRTHEGRCGKMHIMQGANRRGRIPMCVVCCPSRARIFGDLDDPDSEISRTVRSKNAYVLLEEQGTQPKVHYFN